MLLISLFMDGTCSYSLGNLKVQKLLYTINSQKLNLSKKTEIRKNLKLLNFHSILEEYGIKIEYMINNQIKGVKKYGLMLSWS